MWLPYQFSFLYLIEHDLSEDDQLQQTRQKYQIWLTKIQKSTSLYKRDIKFALKIL